MSEGDALAELRRCSGSQFDGELVTVFEALIEELALHEMAVARG
jgi:HD-GYP domain-containing protein (c-di-GMP phosphodiesterase class II)